MSVHGVGFILRPAVVLCNIFYLKAIGTRDGDWRAGGRSSLLNHFHLTDCFDTNALVFPKHNLYRALSKRSERLQFSKLTRSLSEL